MHETSIAHALLEQIRRHTPPGHYAISAHVEAGPYQAINPQALEWAWQVVTQDTELQNAQLQFTALPFDFACPRCGKKWTGLDPLALCPCGSEPRVNGS